MIKPTKKQIQLAILLFIFLCPLILALILSRYELFGRNNYGQWADKNLVWNVQKPTKAPWTLMYKPNGVCAKDCMSLLDKLARVRLAMGRKVYDLDIYLLQSDEQISAHDQHILNAAGIHIELNTVLSPEWATVLAKYPLVLLDHRHHAVLLYPSNFEDKKLYRDLQRLIQ